jgi:FlaA1/EpsC-like NDP-sugar epimerase
MDTHNLMKKLNPFIDFLRGYQSYAIVLIQICLVIAGYLMAFWLRFDFTIPSEYENTLLKTLPYLLVCRMATYYLYKLNSGWWRFVSMVDLVNITKAVAGGTFLFLIGLVFGYGFEDFPRTILIIEGVLNFMFLGGARFLVRWFLETFFKQEAKQLTFALIVGAGEAGVQLLHDIRINPHSGIRVVGFVDDDPFKLHAYIQDVRVLGNTTDLPQLVKEHNIDEVFIAVPSGEYRKIAQLVTVVKDCGIRVKVLPSLIDLVQKEGYWGQLRDVPFDELLTRPVLKFRRESDQRILRNDVEGKSVLITGAAGSIGSELSMQTAELKPRKLILYERNESELYFLELKLRERFPKLNLIPVIGDLLDKRKFNGIVAQHQVNLMYHAAAYKHVPMMEREPFEAVRNNVIATKFLAQTALSNMVEKCVYISTDKAVNPSSMMGATKRVGELIAQAFSGNGTKFIVVRFGNVIGSNGSVIPLFKKQIAKGGPITVTDPEVTRYFMSISEAVQLVMTAGAMAKGGEILLLDMGSPIKVVDLAEKLIRASSLIPGKDIEVKFIGLRPGEKLHEQLYWKGDNILQTANKKITMLKTNGFQREPFFSYLRQLEVSVGEENLDELMEAMRALVPEATLKFSYNGHNNGDNNGHYNNNGLRRMVPPEPAEEVVDRFAKDLTFLKVVRDNC